MASREWRAWQMLALTVLLRPLGNVTLGWGMKHIPAIPAFNAFAYIRAFAHPFVSGGILLLILSQLTRMALLSIADLSVVLPLTAVGYILTTFLSQYFLHESVSVRQWAGTFLVFAGVAIVSSTSFLSGERRAKSVN